mgnify:CR=1 FL=1
MNRHSNIRLQLLLGSALLAVSMPALAQAQTQTIIAPEMTPAGPATGLEDVVVTATKRETFSARPSPSRWSTAKPWRTVR